MKHSCEERKDVERKKISSQKVLKWVHQRKLPDYAPSRLYFSIGGSPPKKLHRTKHPIPVGASIQHPEQRHLGYRVLSSETATSTSTSYIVELSYWYPFPTGVDPLAVVFIVALHHALSIVFEPKSSIAASHCFLILTLSTVSFSLTLGISCCA